METTTDRTVAAEARAVEIGLSPRQLSNFLALIGEPTTSGCRRWQGAHNERGWGKYHGTGAHRMAYRLFIGDIPDGMTIDHVKDRGCEYRDCMTVEHMEPVTVKENVLRGDGPTARHARKTHCDHGHEFTPENTYAYLKDGNPARGCRECRRQSDRRRRSQDRTLAAEVRAVEDGHHAILGHDTDGWFVRVKSDLLGHTGKSWKVRVHTAGPGRPVIFDCHPDGETRDGHGPISSASGRTPCKHMALAARRLEREGLAWCQPPGVYGDIVTTSSRWIATDKTGRPELFAVGSADPETMDRRRAIERAAAGPDGNPFGGFPK